MSIFAHLSKRKCIAALCIAVVEKYLRLRIKLQTLARIVCASLASRTVMTRFWASTEPPLCALRLPRSAASAHDMLERMRSEPLDERTLQRVQAMVDECECRRTLKRVLSCAVRAHRKAPSQLTDAALLEIVAAIDYSQRNSEAGACSLIARACAGKRTARPALAYMKAWCERELARRDRGCG